MFYRQRNGGPRGKGPTEGQLAAGKQGSQDVAVLPLLRDQTHQGNRFKIHEMEF